MTSSLGGALEADCGAIRIEHGDCLGAMRTLPDNSIDLIATDPPYYRVKNEAWDRQWDSPEKFIEWIGELCMEWQRLLKPNGSLYVFASPKMAARVEVAIGEAFDIVNRITWRKPPFSTKAEMHPKQWQRGYFPVSEAVIFAEHYGSDSYAKGEAGYAAKCDELRGFLFEPLRAYLASEVARSGWKLADLNRDMGFAPRGMVETHYFGRSQWRASNRTELLSDA